MTDKGTGEPARAKAAVPLPGLREPGKLVGKLASVMGALEHVPKRGRNAFFGYEYALEADIADAVRAGLAAQGIVIIPHVRKLAWRQVETKAGPMPCATLHVRFTVTDGVESFDFTVVGEGADAGDKATYKAMTGAMKYALLKLFLISTGDDPDADLPAPGTSTTPAPARAAAAPAPKPAPTPAPAGRQPGEDDGPPAGPDECPKCHTRQGVLRSRFPGPTWYHIGCKTSFGPKNDIKKDQA